MCYFSVWINVDWQKYLYSKLYFQTEQMSYTYLYIDLNFFVVFFTCLAKKVYLLKCHFPSEDFIDNFL